MRRGSGVLLAAALVLTGCAQAPRAVVPTAAPAPAPAAATQDLPAVPPVRLRIPAIGVDTSLVDLTTDPTGTLVPPDGPDDAGWFTAGPAPGERGPALLAGHVDSRGGPAVFYRLRELAPGDVVEVDRADGSTVRFTVTGSTQIAKEAFPTEIVYAPTPGAELRLVTCGGTFDHGSGHYVDNVIVDAVQEGGQGWTIVR